MGGVIRRFVVDRMACVDLPAFPLQLLVRDHPDWRGQPVAVVDKDKPQGVILWVNSRARRFRILPGMKYAQGLSLSSELRAGVVSQADIERHVRELTEALQFYSADVEAFDVEPGVFWLDASGLSLLYPSLRKWAGLIGEELTKANFVWTVAVGFSRFGTYAASKSAYKRDDAKRGKRIVFFDKSQAEHESARRVPIDRLSFEPDTRDTLARLGIHHVGGFIDLPQEGIRKRFGDTAHKLYLLARDEMYSPIQAAPHPDPLVAQIGFDHPEKSVGRLMPVVELMLTSLLSAIESRACLLTAVTLRLELDNGEHVNEHLKPAKPTLDANEVLQLIDLRLNQVKLPSGVVDLTIEADSVRSRHNQGELFEEKPPRDLEAINRAFARLRAELGDHAVMYAELRDGHLPEARYEWRPLERIDKPEARKVKTKPLVRRIFSRAIGFIGRSSDSHEGVFLSTINSGAVRELLGPFVISGGWWIRRVHREYYFARTASGRWLWVYYDRRRRKFYQQGAVE